MKITKNFEMTLSGKYQSYRVGTTLEVDVPVEQKDEAAKLLAQEAIAQTMADILQFREENEAFRMVVQARADELVSYGKQLAKRMDLSDNPPLI